MLVSGNRIVPNYPVLRKWMLFVDGENFTIRAQEVLSTAKVTTIEGKFWRKDTFI
jgi:hypothetical protein